MIRGLWTDMIVGRPVADRHQEAGTRSRNSPSELARRIVPPTLTVGTGAGHGLLLRDRLGGIWEAASGANRPEPVPTELKQSL